MNDPAVEGLRHLQTHPVPSFRKANATLSGSLLDAELGGLLNRSARIAAGVGEPESFTWLWNSAPAAGPLPNPRCRAGAYSTPRPLPPGFSILIGSIGVEPWQRICYRTTSHSCSPARHHRRRCGCGRPRVDQRAGCDEASLAGQVELCRRRRAGTSFWNRAPGVMVRPDSELGNATIALTPSTIEPFARRNARTTSAV